MIKAWHGIPSFGDGRAEFPDQIVTEDVSRFAFVWITWTVGRLKEFLRHINRGNVFSGFSEPDFIRFVQTVTDSCFGTIDFSQLMTKAIEAISFGNSCPFPDANASIFEYADQCRPVIHVGWRAGLAIGGNIPRTS